MHFILHLILGLSVLAALGWLIGRSGLGDKIDEFDDAINRKFNLDPKTFAVAAIVVATLFWLLG
jgi:uncharacterized membrane protein